MYKQGEIAIIPFPFSDLSNIKSRPVLILSKDEDCLNNLEIVTCGITSNLDFKKYSVSIDNNSLEKGIIPKKSCIRIDKLFTVNKNIIRKVVAKVNNKKMNEVKKEFRNIV